MIWFLFVAIGLGTIILRSAFILKSGAGTTDRLSSIRRFVPIAVLTALVVPALMPRNGEPSYARAMAAVAAGAIAYRFQNMFATVAAGLALLLLLR